MNAQRRRIRGRRAAPAPPPEPRAPMDPHQVRMAHMVASRLLTYPDAELVGCVGQFTTALSGLPDEVRAPLRRMLDHVAATPPTELAAGYVETFDQWRRGSLYLTYHTHGDTRRRGEAMLRFKQTYRDAGMEATDEELPDHLAVVLEFSARGNVNAALRLLREHQTGLELLSRALESVASPYLDVVTAVRATLPDPTAEEVDAALRLAREGPPAETVGLDLAPYAADPSLDPAGGRR